MEVDINASLVCQLISTQFPQWAEAFRSALQVDDATWARGWGWVLWKGLIILAQHINTNPIEAEKARHIIEEVLTDYKHAT